MTPARRKRLAMVCASIPNWRATSGQRESGCVEIRGVSEDLVVPCRLFAVPRDAVAVEVGGDRGSVDAEFDGEFVDRGASPIGVNESVDAGGGEASLGRV